jgi:hypothetical protein
MHRPDKTRFHVMAVCMIALCTISPCMAELYKWIDEQGHTHYGDQPDSAADKQAATVVQLPEVPTGNDPAALPVSRTKPRLIVYTRELPAEKRAIGSYHYDDYCQQAMPMYWPDTYNFHPDLVPDGGKLTELLIQALGSLGYPLQPNLTPGQPASENANGLLLTMTVTDADIKACASHRKKRDIFLKPSSVLPDEFDRLQISLALEWELATPDGKIIYRGRSNGKSGNLTNTHNIYNTWVDAITAATAQLDHDQAFQAAIAQTLPAPGIPSDTLTARNALMRQPQQHLPHIVITALPLADTRQQMGILRAGQFCRNVTPLQWPDIRNLRASLAPDTLKIASAAAKSLANFDYAVLQASPDTALAQQRRIDGLLLQIQVSRLYLDACAPDTKEPANTYGPKAVAYSSYKRYQLQLALDWTLLSPDGKQLFNGHTDSTAGNLQVNNDIEDVYARALDQSVMQLLSNTLFQQALILSALPATTTADTSGAQPATGWLDNLGKFSLWSPGNMLQRANLASVLAGMSQVKVAMTEYYFSEGKWPTRFEEMGITPPPVINNAQLILQPNGVLVADLPDSFGNNKVLLLRAPADPTAIGAQWHCETNVDSRPDTCSGF